MSTQNYFTQPRQESEIVTGVDTDGSGQAVITVTGLRQIESPADVTAQAAGGYLVNVLSVSGNDVTVEVRASAGTAGNELPLVTGTADVTDVHINAFGQ